MKDGNKYKTGENGKNFKDVQKMRSWDLLTNPKQMEYVSCSDIYRATFKPQFFPRSLTFLGVFLAQ